MLVEFLQHHLAPLWSTWIRANMGFYLPADEPGVWARMLVALNWADNMWWFSSSLEDGVMMCAQLSKALYGSMKLRWKPSSLKILPVLPALMSTAGAPPEGRFLLARDETVEHTILGGLAQGCLEVHHECPEGPHLFSIVQTLDILGVRVTDQADTYSMQQQKQLGATASLARKRKILTCKLAPLSKRVDGL